eukprot:371999_1
MSQSLQQILICGYVQQFQQNYTLSMIPIEIVNMIYSFYPKKRMINEWITNKLINYETHRKIRQAIHFKTGEISLLTSIPIDSKNPLKISDSKIHKILQEFNIVKKINHENIIPFTNLNINAFEYDNNGNKTQCILYIFNHNHYCLLFDIICFIGCLNDNASRTYFQQIINGLLAIYELEIIAYSIMQHHLFLDSTFKLKLMIETDTFEIENSPQPKYMTPSPTSSFLTKDNRYKRSNNIFNIGILLFTMYAGFPPFQNAIDTDWWWDKLSKGWKYLVASEKQKYQKDREKYVAVSTRKIQLFWKAHERTRIFNDKIKNIIIHMLHPYNDYRYKIENIKRHKWYQEQCYNQKQLQTYMKDKLVETTQTYNVKIQKLLQQKAVMDLLDYEERCEYKTQNINNINVFKYRAKELDPYNDFMSNMEILKDEMLIMYGTYQFFTTVKPAEIAARLEVVADRNGNKLTV